MEPRKLEGTVVCGYCGWRMTDEREQAFAGLNDHQEQAHAAQLAMLANARELVFAGLPENWELEDFGGWVYGLVFAAQERAKERVPEFTKPLQELRRALELWRLSELFFDDPEAQEWSESQNGERTAYRGPDQFSAPLPEEYETLPLPEDVEQRQRRR